MLVVIPCPALLASAEADATLELIATAAEAESLFAEDVLVLLFVASAEAVESLSADADDELDWSADATAIESDSAKANASELFGSVSKKYAKVI